MDPNRPADYGGWFNHPVTLSFRGADATSGLASCSTVPYGGPDGGPAMVSGGCSDVAGNSSSAAFPIYYDATPPAPPAVGGLPANHGAQVSWRAAADVTGVTIVRTPRGGAPSVVFSGGGASFRDRKLRNGVRYRYDVVAVDQAGNRSQGSVSLVPTASRLLTPAKGARLRTPPLLRWRGVRRARYYNVQLYHGRRKVLTAWPRRPELQLKRTWRYARHRRRLGPGRYRWYVWPGYGRVSAGRYGRVLGSSSFTVVR